MLLMFLSYSWFSNRKVTVIQKTLMQTDSLMMKSIDVLLMIPLLMAQKCLLREFLKCADVVTNYDSFVFFLLRKMAFKILLAVVITKCSK